MRPGFESLVEDEGALSLWEVIRRENRAITADRLAEIVGMPAGQVERQIGRLHAGGLLRPARVRGAAAHAAVPPSELPEATIRRLHDASRKLAAARTDRHVRGSLQRPASTSGIGFGVSVRLGDAELLELRRRVEELRRFMSMTQHAAGPARGRRMEAPVACTHHVTVQVLPLAVGELPLPDGQTMGPGEERAGRAEPLRGLSPRERQVAVALMAGQTMRQVAEALGLSFFTVDTLVRRVYRKLGVKRRAEFIMRMRDAERG